MSTASYNNVLEALHASLAELQDPALPKNTRDSVQRVEQNLSALEERLQDNEEQKHLAALYRVSQTLGSSLNLDEVLNHVMDAVIELTEAERGFLMLSNSETGKLDLQVARNLEREDLNSHEMEVSRTVTRTVLQNEVPVLTTNAQTDPRFSAQDSIINYALRSILCVPLRARGKIIGVIYVDNRARAGLFTQDDINILNTFAVQAAVAIENAQLYTQTDENLTARVKELETLTKIDQELTAQLDLDRVLEIACTWAVKETGAEESWIALTGQGNSALTVASGANKGQRILQEAPLVRQALAARTPQHLPPEEEKLAQVVVPLVQGDQTFGILVVEGLAAFPEDAQSFLVRLAARAASAIGNARLYQAVQEANRAKSKFVSVVSHELRIPMTSIKGYTDLMIKGLVGEINDQQENFLGVIRNNVGRMAALVSDLSDVSRVETGRLSLELTPMPMHTYVEQVVGTVRQSFEEKSQTLHVNVPHDLPYVHADPNRVMQVLTNILSNANKYTENDGEITISVQPKDGVMHVAIADNGIGISPEDQAKLFSQFFRSEADAVRSKHGWGLGLNVTKNLVELMKGEIGAQSTLGVGSTFWFTLPLAEMEE